MKNFWQGLKALSLLLPLAVLGEAYAQNTYFACENARKDGQPIIQYGNSDVVVKIIGSVSNRVLENRNVLNAQIAYERVLKGLWSPVLGNEYFFGDETETLVLRNVRPSELDRTLPYSDYVGYTVTHETLKEMLFMAPKDIDPGSSFMGHLRMKMPPFLETIDLECKSLATPVDLEKNYALKRLNGINGFMAQELYDNLAVQEQTKNDLHKEILGEYKEKIGEFYTCLKFKADPQQKVNAHFISQYNCKLNPSTYEKLYQSLEGPEKQYPGVAGWTAWIKESSHIFCSKNENSQNREIVFHCSFKMLNK